MTSTGVSAGVAPVDSVGNGPGIGNAIHLVTLTGGSAAASATIYDNTSAAGKSWTIGAPIGQTVYPDYNGMTLNKGCWVVVTGTGAVLNIQWE
jgi:hypothetical protein